jgi:hypothetical protein
MKNYEVINIPNTEYKKGFILETCRIIKKIQGQEDIEDFVYVWFNKGGKKTCSRLSMNEVQKLLDNKNIKIYEGDIEAKKASIFNS